MGKEWRVIPDSFKVEWDGPGLKFGRFNICSSVRMECDPVRSPGGTVDRTERTILAEWNTAPDHYPPPQPSPLDIANSLDYLVERIRGAFPTEEMKRAENLEKLKETFKGNPRGDSCAQSD